jgi:predicted acyltransferase
VSELKKEPSMAPHDPNGQVAAPVSLQAPPVPAVREEPIRTVSREPEAPTAPAKPARLTSLDAYRGFIMLAMVSAGLYLWKVAPLYPDNWLWQVVGYQTNHVAWTGCAFWDLIQPAFMFMVGVALPYSFASRQARGDSYRKMFTHAAVRAFVLIALGVFLTSNGARQTDFLFTNVLCQIGLGYLFVFLLVNRGWALQLLTAVLVLAGYWYLFFQHPLPPPNFNYAAVHAEGETFSGVYAHWNKNANFAAVADLHLLNWFPRPKPFEFNEGGYQTLNFVPSLATMIFGLMAGEFLRRRTEGKIKFRVLLGAGVIGLVFGLLLDYTIWPSWLAARLDWLTRVEGSDAIGLFHVCPIVKRIWSPSWAVFSTGWALVMLAAFYWAIDLKGYRRWAFPLVVVGMNSITMYCMAQLMKRWVRETLETHLGQNIFHKWTFGSVVIYPHYDIAWSAAVLAVLWLICLWLYRQKIFVRI